MIASLTTNDVGTLILIVMFGVALFLLFNDLHRKLQKAEYRSQAWETRCSHAEQLLDRMNQRELCKVLDDEDLDDIDTAAALIFETIHEPDRLTIERRFNSLHFDYKLDVPTPDQLMHSGGRGSQQVRRITECLRQLGWQLKDPDIDLNHIAGPLVRIEE